MDVLGADEISLRSRSSTRTCNASYPSPFYAETVEPTAQLGRGISTVVITASASNRTSVSNMSCAPPRSDSISRSRVRSEVGVRSIILNLGVARGRILEFSSRPRADAGDPRACILAAEGPGGGPAGPSEGR